MASTIYIVPTPIGNLNDITLRALDILKQVDLIAAEDTRRTSLLLQRFRINTPMTSLHVHNEQKKTDQLILQLKSGLDVALVSDAGTPLINDPGFYLVKCCRQAGIKTVPLPGACAAITALSVAAIASDRFCYEGFLPTKQKIRQKILQQLINEPRTLIFYESPHRLLDTLSDMVSIWGARRYVVLARELTKIWESVHGLPVGELLDWVKVDKNRSHGEIVLVVEGHEMQNKNNNNITLEAQKTFFLLQKLLSFKKAVIFTAKIHNLKKNTLYKYALKEQKSFFVNGRNK